MLPFGGGCAPPAGSLMPRPAWLRRPRAEGPQTQLTRIAAAAYGRPPCIPHSKGLAWRDAGLRTRALGGAGAVSGTLRGGPPDPPTWHGRGTAAARPQHGHGTAAARSRPPHAARSRHGRGTVAARSRHGRGTAAARSQSAANSTPVSELLARRAGLGCGPLAASQQGELDSKPCSCSSLGLRRRSRHRGLLRGLSFPSNR